MTALKTFSTSEIWAQRPDLSSSYLWTQPHLTSALQHGQLSKLRPALLFGRLLDDEGDDIFPCNSPARKLNGQKVCHHVKGFLFLALPWLKTFYPSLMFELPPILVMLLVSDSWFTDYPNFTLLICNLNYLLPQMFQILLFANVLIHHQLAPYKCPL